MKAQAAKKGKLLLFAALALLAAALVAPSAEASRTLPPALTSTQTPAPPLELLDQVGAGDVTTGQPFALLTDDQLSLIAALALLEPDDPLPAGRFRLFPDSPSLPRRLELLLALETASGEFSTEIEYNLLQRKDFDQESRWTIHLYAFVAWGPQSGIDPMGLALAGFEDEPCNGIPFAHCAQPESEAHDVITSSTPRTPAISAPQRPVATVGPPRPRLVTMGPAEPTTEFGEVGDALYAGGAFFADPSNYVNAPILLLNAQESVLFGRDYLEKGEGYVPPVFELKSERQKQWTAALAVVAIARSAGKPKGLVRNDRALARNLNLSEGHTPHHLITVAEAEKFPVMHRAADLGYDINRAENGIALPNTVDLAKELEMPYHPQRGRHTVETYTGPLAARLEKLQQLYESGLITDATLLEEVAVIESSMRTALMSGDLRLNSRYPWYSGDAGSSGGR